MTATLVICQLLQNLMPPLLAQGISPDVATPAALLAVVFGVHPLNIMEFSDKAFPGSAHVLTVQIRQI
jgi:hypothetical protein